QTTLAGRLWEEGHVAPIAGLLEAHRPSHPGDADFRGFEWYYLWRLCHNDRVNFRNHGNHVQCAAFSPDSRRIASGSYDKTVRIWDSMTGQEFLILKGHTAPVRGVAFSHDGKMLGSVASDATVRVWDTATGLELFKLQAQTEGLGIAFSPLEKTLATPAGNS